MSAWQKLDSQVIYKNKWMTVKEDDVINPLGEKTIYGYYALASNFAYIVPIDADGNTYIVQQYRYPVSQECWEFPSGQSEGQDMESAARRELLEETGLEAGTLKKLGAVFADTGISSSQGSIFLARDVKKVTNNLDEADGISAVKKLSLDKVRAMIVAGTIQCPHTISAFFMATEYLKKPKG